MADKRQPWIKWYTRDWRADAPLRMCSFAARGLWADMLTLMAESRSFGFLLIEGVVPTAKQLAGLLGGTEREITKLRTELGAANVFSVTGIDVPADVAALVPVDMPEGVILSRRMVRDKAKAAAASETGKHGALGGNPEIPRGVVPKEERVRAYRRTDSPEKTMRIFNMHDGQCHWCGVELLFKPDGGRNGFHVDHVVAVCDGGTNDDDNLVPSCADCNHKRARLDMVGRARQQPQHNPTITPQRSEVRDQTSVAKATAADPVKQIFDEGIDLLVKTGTAAGRARAVIGQWRSKAKNDERVAGLIREAVARNISSPIPWFVKALETPENDPWAGVDI